MGHATIALEPTRKTPDDDHLMRRFLLNISFLRSCFQPDGLRPNSGKNPRIAALSLLVLSTLLVHASCRRQVKPQTDKTLNWVPVASQAVLWIPKPEQALFNAVQWAQSCGTKLYTRQQLAQFVQHTLQIEVIQDNMLEQLGLSERAGVVGFVPPQTRDILWIAAVHNPEKLEKSLRFFSQKFLAAQDFETTHAGDLPVVSATYPFGTDKIPVLHWAMVDDCVVITFAEGAQTLHDFLQNRATIAAQHPDVWTDKQAALAYGHAYLKVSHLDTQALVPPSGVLASFRFEPQGVAADAQLTLETTHADSLRKLFADTAPNPPEPRYTPEGSWFLARTGAQMQASSYLQLLHTPEAQRLFAPLQSELQRMDLWDNANLWAAVAGPASLSARPATQTGITLQTLYQARDPWAPFWQWTWITKLQDSGKMQAFFTKWHKQHRHLRTIKQQKLQIGTQHTQLYSYEDKTHPFSWAVYPPYWVMTTGQDKLVTLLQDLAQTIETNAQTLSTLAFEDAWKKESGSFGIVYGAHIAQSLRNSWRDVSRDPNRVLLGGQPALIDHALQLIENLGTFGMRIQLDSETKNPNQTTTQKLRVQLRERTG